MKVILWLTILLTTGCSVVQVAEDLDARGCHFKCDWCVNLDAICADDYNTIGAKKSGRFNPLNTPNVDVEVEIKK